MNGGEFNRRTYRGFVSTSVLFLTLGWTASSVFGGPVVYVNQAATGVGDGSSWTDSYTDLQAALDAAEASGGAIREIWVAYGTYKPSKRTDPDDPRSATFQLLNGVSIYGGFAGTETSVDERDIEANQTTLSGDFNYDDYIYLQEFFNYDENAYHVVTMIDAAKPTMFDGFTVTGGHSQENAGGYENPRRYGGGMFLINSSPEIRNCTFTRNLSERPGGNTAWVGGGGAALFLYQEDTDLPPPPLTVFRSRFTDNSSFGDGGAVLFWGGYEAGSIIFSECSFEHNDGLGAFTGYGGTAQTFRSCSFSDNSSNQSGGAISDPYGSGELLIEQCRFERNTALAGGAVHWNGGRSVSILNSIFVNNSSESDYGGALLISQAETVVLSDSEFIGNSSGYVGGVGLLRNGPTNVQRCQFVDNSANDWGGGGLHVSGNFSTNVADCTFANNRARSGGGLYTDAGAVTIEHCTFSANYAADQGGGLAARGSTSLVGCTFRWNSAEEGGGVHDDGSALEVVDTAFNGNYAAIGGGVLAGSYYGARFEACRFSNNTAYIGGGAALGERDSLFHRCEFTNNRATVGGGLSALERYGTTDVASCVFGENEADAYGGAIAGSGGPLRIKNSTVAHNRSRALGAGLMVSNDTTIRNSVVWDNAVTPGGEVWYDETAQIEGIEFATIEYSNIQGWSGAYGGYGNIGDDPLFVNPYDPDGPGSGQPDFHLLPDSPCINAGLTETIDWVP